jgi:hypothetical protein
MESLYERMVLFFCLLLIIIMLIININIYYNNYNNKKNYKESYDNCPVCNDNCSWYDVPCHVNYLDCESRRQTCLLGK